MAAVIVCGGGVIGLSTAMMLARDGHVVTVFEEDAAEAPGAAVTAWDDWQRTGVAQFRQPHMLLPGAKQVLDAELPGLTQLLLAAGAVEVDLLALPPPGVTDNAPRPGDDRFTFPTGRRPVVEAVFAAAARDTPGVTIRRGVPVEALLPGQGAVDGTAHVVGVRLGGGAELAADLVVDAMGRRSPAGDWLMQLGGTAPAVETEENGFAYYTRYYTGPELPVRIGPGTAPMGSFSVLTLPADNDTWSVTLFTASRDVPLKELRHAETFERVIRACPAHAQWLAGTPITGVLAMAGILDRYRRFVIDERPVATGFAAVGDAWACTNPSAGRGISVGLRHAQALREVVAEQLGDPVGFATAWDAATETRVTPFYRFQVDTDRARMAEMRAHRDGVEPPPPPPVLTKVQNAAMRDADTFRAMLDILTGLALPQEVLARPGLSDKLEELGGGPPLQMPGPDRAQLLALLAG